MITFEKYLASISLASPPTHLSIILEALWWDKKGNWQNAHALIDHLQDKKSAHVHAYLHRKELDAWNAHYWYTRAQQEVFTGSFEEEWTSLVKQYL